MTDTGAGTPLTANIDGSPCWCDRGQGHTAECVARWSEWLRAGRPPFAVRPATAVLDENLTTALVTTLRRDDICDDTEGEHHTDDFIAAFLIALDTELRARALLSTTIGT